MKKKYLLLGLIFGLIILFVISYFLIKNRSEDDVIKEPNNIPSVDFGMVLEKEFKSNSLWEYKVTGQFPNPCYTANVEEFVRESYPEQVTILVTVSKPSGDMICAQVISDFEHEGTFSASEKAQITLEIKQ